MHKLRRKQKNPCFTSQQQQKTKSYLVSSVATKKSTKQMMVGSRNTNNYRLMRLLAARSQPKKLHFESDLSGIFSTTYHSKFENRNFVNKRTKVSINFSLVLNPETWWLVSIAIQVVEFSNEGYKTRKIFAWKSTYLKEIIEF